MSDERTTLEVIAPTVEEAVSKGCSDLGLPEDAVEVEILDSGSRGIFGLGSRQARIRLTIKGAKETVSTSMAPVASNGAGGSQGTMDEEEDLETELEPNEDVEEQVSTEFVAEEDQDSTLRLARETITELLEKMKVHARVTTHYGEVENPKDERPILIEIHGNDLSILIGRKSETLNALQYISGLIISKEVGKWVPVQVDVEGYRARRERMLRQLARRMADQTVSTGRRQVLEPMPANERRVIHMELHDHPKVMTESIGEEPNRKVTISLKTR